MSTQPLPNAPEPQSTAQPLHANPAVDQCLQRWNAMYKAELARTGVDMKAVFAAGKAYRHAMPSLDGHDNIRNFIACVAHGVLIGAITHLDSSKLLYAAQVALSAVRVKLALPAAQAAPAADGLQPG